MHTLTPPTTSTGWSSLPRHLQECIARLLPAQDLLCLAATSRDAQAMAGPLWRDAYGPFPCHRDARSEAAWRQAVAEQAACHRRLLAPLGSGGEGTKARARAVQERSRWLLERHPKWAYVALQLLGPAMHAGTAAHSLALEALHAAQLAPQAGVLAAQSLRAKPDEAPTLMALGAQLGCGAVCLAAAQAGATWVETEALDLRQAGATGDIPMLSLYLAHRGPQAPPAAAHGGGASAAPPRDRLAEALDAAIEHGQAACVRFLAGAPQSRASCQAPQANLALRGSPAAVEESLRLLRSLGISPLTCFGATAAADTPSAWEAARQILAACMPQEEVAGYLSAYAGDLWQRVYGRHSPLRYDYAEQQQQLKVLKGCVALGARFSIGRGALQEALTSYGNLDVALLAIRAGHPPYETVLSGESLADMIISRGLVNARRAGEWVAALRDAGVRFDPRMQAKVARLVACEHFPALLPALLDMGLDPNLRTHPDDQALLAHAQPVLFDTRPDPNLQAVSGGKTLLMWAAQRGLLASLRALMEHGAAVHEYDRDFKTALDWCTDAACREFLRSAAAGA